MSLAPESLQNNYDIELGPDVHEAIGSSESKSNDLIEESVPVPPEARARHPQLSPSAKTMNLNFVNLWPSFNY